MTSYILLWVLMQASDLKQQRSGSPTAVYTTEQACAAASQKDYPQAPGWDSGQWVPHPLGQETAYFTHCKSIVLDPK
jgi:hypothetical protein